MFTPWLVSPIARVQYGRVHQRAWVESLDQWRAFRELTRYGSPVTEAMCDICIASRHGTAFGEGHSGSYGSGRSA